MCCIASRNETEIYGRFDDYFPLYDSLKLFIDNLRRMRHLLSHFQLYRVCLHLTYSHFFISCFTGRHEAHVPLYLYPFLNTVSKHRAFEYLRLTSLGVIGALVKVDDSEVVSFLLQTEIVPLCLRIMENGSELSKTVATFIVQKVLLDDVGLAYICANTERFYAVVSFCHFLCI